MTDVNHLDVTVEIVRAVLRNPQVTYEDLDAMYFSLVNHPDFGITHPLVSDVLKKQNEIVLKGYRNE